MKKTSHKKVVLFLMILFIMLTCTLSTSSAQNVKSVILMIPDGMSVSGTTLARWYKGSPLAMDEMASGLVRTYSADAAIADSAPAGTAYATGFKSHTGFIGILPDENTMPGLKPITEEDKRRPVATILEAAKLAGKSTGLVATCELPHATPAAFSAHVADRNNYDDILEQQVYAGIDVVLAGGYKFLSPEERRDKENLLEIIKASGYDYITTPEALRKSTANKIWGMFAPKDLSYDFDRDPEKEPSLAEMTKKAIEVLSKNPKGFFLMVEGSKIDWAAHANDPVGVISDILAFDEAVKVALDFAKKDGRTIVIAVADHGNGGISIGDQETSKNYDTLPLSTFIDPLKKAKLTGEGLEKKLNQDRSNIKDVMATYYGISDLTEEELKKLQDAKPGKFNYVAGPIISKRAHIGWTTNGHTGEDVVLYIYAPPRQKRLTGVIENTYIAKYMEKAMGLDLAATTNRLLTSAAKDLTTLGANISKDSTNPANPVFVVTKGKTAAKFPVNKNIIEVNGSIVKLPGVIVDNGKTFFIPRKALNYFK
ncbi:MAG: alkaline phosphatase [Thermodesulforhabdaceae bacterium]